MLPFTVNVFENSVRMESLAQMINLIKKGGQQITCVLPSEPRGTFLEFRIFAGPVDKIFIEKTGLGSGSSPAPCLIEVDGESERILREVTRVFTQGMTEQKIKNATVWS